MRRRIVREKVVQALYAHEISGDPPDHVIQCILSGLENNKPAYEFARRLVLHTISHSAEIDRIIRAKVANWDFQRIAVLGQLADKSCLSIESGIVSVDRREVGTRGTGTHVSVPGIINE